VLLIEHLRKSKKVFIAVGNVFENWLEIIFSAIVTFLNIRENLSSPTNKTGLNFLQYVALLHMQIYMIALKSSFTSKNKIHFLFPFFVFFNS
jgi:hypothetical protein